MVLSDSDEMEASWRGACLPGYLDYFAGSS